MMFKFFLSSFFILVGLFFPANLWARTESANYIIWADVFNVGGLESSGSANYSIQDSIGEALILSATSTATNYGIKAGFREMYADQYITLSSSSATVALGNLSLTETRTGSHTLTVATNAPGGYTITIVGSTLVSGSNNIDAIGATAAASAVGTEQFGINLAANTSPSVGANPAGTSPIGAAAGQYATADRFAFQSGDTVASASSATNQTVFTVSYVANISPSTLAGGYATALTYSATANF